jgi:hypothetical protein
MKSPELVSDAELHRRLTHEHIHVVRDNISVITEAIFYRGVEHDHSKFTDEESIPFARNIRRLSTVEYGTPEYDEMLKDVKPALDHHYANNRHHPEYWPNGIDDMDLVDILEMFCDWVAAVKRNKNGDIMKSIDTNEKRFNISPQLTSIFRNTANRYFNHEA